MSNRSRRASRSKPAIPHGAAAAAPQGSWEEAIAALEKLNPKEWGPEREERARQAFLRRRQRAERRRHAAEIARLIAVGKASRKRWEELHGDGRQ